LYRYSKAKFDKSARRLEVTLPVKPGEEAPAEPYSEPSLVEEVEEEEDGFAKIESPRPATKVDASPAAAPAAPAAAAPAAAEEEGKEGREGEGETKEGDVNSETEESSLSPSPKQEAAQKSWRKAFVLMNATRRQGCYTPLPGGVTRLSHGP
jgi:hypothetical protein